MLGTPADQVVGWVAVVLGSVLVGMNLALGAMTGFGKTWVSQAYTERNLDEFDGIALIDYKDEYKGLVEAFDIKRLTVPGGAEAITREGWEETLSETPRIQLARAGATTEQFREAMASVVAALGDLDGTWFVVVDEAHKLASQRGACPDPFETLATTWHGDGMGGFRSTQDLQKIEAVEYPVEVHQTHSERVSRPLPDALQVDGENLTLRRFTEDDGHTTGSEWIYTDSTDLRRIDTREWVLDSTHYGSDRKRIKQPFEEA